MTLHETLLQNLAERRPHSDRQVLRLADEAGWALDLALDRTEALGCQVWELGLRRPAPLADAAALRAWAERVAARATGLLEHLKLLELDGDRGVALLRSEEPAQRGEEVYYYELRLAQSGAADLRRYHGARRAGARREQVAFVLTHEALAKLAGDLASDK
jgi:hypothetical protein